MFAKYHNICKLLSINSGAKIQKERGREKEIRPVWQNVNGWEISEKGSPVQGFQLFYNGG